MITWIARAKKSGYLVSTLLLSRFDEVCDLTLIGSDVIIAPDSGNDRRRLLNLKTNQTSTLSTCSKDECYHPYSLLATDNALLIKLGEKIREFECKYKAHQ